MKRVVLVLMLLVCPLLAVAQDAPKPQLYLIHEEVAIPSMVMQYESTTREILAALTESKADSSALGMRLYSTPDFHYVYVMPINGFAGMDKISDAWQAFSSQIGKDRWQRLMSRANAAMASYSEAVVMMRPDLSYWPATPRVKMEDERYVRWDFYYLMPGKEGEAEQVAKDIAALFKSKNISDPFTIFMAVSGHDLPLLIVSTSGKSAADYAANDEKLWATLGDPFRALLARALSVTRKYEVREAMPRPELSYPMVKMASK